MRDQLQNLFVDHLAEPANANPAQLLVVWAAESYDPDRFHLIEVYADQAALEANANAQWFADYMTAAAPLMATEPTVSMCEPRWSKGLV